MRDPAGSAAVLLWVVMAVAAPVSGILKTRGILTYWVMKPSAVVIRWT